MSETAPPPAPSLPTLADIGREWDAQLARIRTQLDELLDLELARATKRLQQFRDDLEATLTAGPGAVTAPTAAAPLNPPLPAEPPSFSVVGPSAEPEADENATAPSDDPDLAAAPELEPEDQPAPVDGAPNDADIKDEDRPAPQDVV